MTLTPQQLYQEFEGTLSPQDDPSSQGSQAAVYGYLIGNGMSFVDKQNEINKRQSNGTGRPIEVNIRTPDKVGPGVVSEPVFIQGLLDAVSLQEWRDVHTAAGQTREQADVRLFELRIIGSGLDAQLGVTDGAQNQLLGIFDNANWPDTRADLIELLSRPGSRTEEMQGFLITADDMRAAEEWGQANGKQSLFE